MLLILEPKLQHRGCLGGCIGLTCVKKVETKAYVRHFGRTRGTGGRGVFKPLPDSYRNLSLILINLVLFWNPPDTRYPVCFETPSLRSLKIINTFSNLCGTTAAQTLPAKLGIGRGATFSAGIVCGCCPWGWDRGESNAASSVRRCYDHNCTKCN